VNHHLRDHSEGDSIVLVPGLDGTALLFYRQIPKLAERFNVVSFPLPDDANATMDGLVQDLTALITEVAPGRTVLVGESFGGALCLSTALAAPELVDGLVLVNSFPWLHRRVQLHIAPLLLRIVPWAAMPAIRRLTESRLHSPHTNDEDLAEFHERSRQIDRVGYRRRLETLGQYDIREQLHEIAAPTLILAGDRDRLLPSVRSGRYMAERIPDAEFHILEGYGHICLINHDLDLIDHVAPWWDEAMADR
jgi:pimeloyl-ACP methyl ester carboxylesterase